MTTTLFATDWHALIDPKLDDFIATGTMVLDDVFGADDLTALQAESGFIDYKEAHLTHGEGRLTSLDGILTPRYIQAFAHQKPIMHAIRQALATNGTRTTPKGEMSGSSLRCFI